MVRLSDLVNPIPVGMVFKYSPGDNVMYDGKNCLVFRQRDCNGKPSYQLRVTCDGSIVDKALESKCKDCCTSEIIKEAWESFVYTGDNKLASKYIIEHVIKPCHSGDINFGHNETSSKYFISWFCCMDNKQKTLEKNRV